MRRRWSLPEQFLGALAGIYGLGWIPGIIAAEAVDGEPGIDIFLAVWFGPAMIGGAIYGLHLMWHHRPKRVTEAVTTDLRAVPPRAR